MSRRDDDSLIVAIVLFLIGASGGVKVPTIPKPPKPITPHPPQWWIDMGSPPEPPGWPAGAPWPPFDENGDWIRRTSRARKPR